MAANHSVTIGSDDLVDSNQLLQNNNNNMSILINKKNKIISSIGVIQPLVYCLYCSFSDLVS